MPDKSEMFDCRMLEKMLEVIRSMRLLSNEAADKETKETAENQNNKIQELQAEVERVTLTQVQTEELDLLKEANAKLLKQLEIVNALNSKLLGKLSKSKEENKTLSEEIKESDKKLKFMEDLDFDVLRLNALHIGEENIEYKR